MSVIHFAVPKPLDTFKPEPSTDSAYIEFTIDSEFVRDYIDDLRRQIYRVQRDVLNAEIIAISIPWKVWQGAYHLYGKEKQLTVSGVPLYATTSDEAVVSYGVKTAAHIDLKRSTKDAN